MSTESIYLCKSSEDFTYNQVLSRQDGVLELRIIIQFSLNSNSSRRTMPDETSPLLGSVSGEETAASLSGASHTSNNGARDTRIVSPNLGLPESSKPGFISYLTFVSLSFSSLKISNNI